ncbi:putative nuclease HARBI1 [Tanacetum coccineum]
MKGRFKRLSENRSKWVAAYRAAYSRKTSGMSLKDVELDAHKIYKGDGSKFLDLTVFNEVMCKNPKWMLNIDHDNTRSHCIDEEHNEESSGSTKGSRTSKEGEYVVHSNQEILNSSELRAMRITRKSEIEVMNKRLEINKKREEREIKKEERELKREEREIKKEERNTKKMYLSHLNALLAKDHVSPEEKDMKCNLSISSNLIEYHEWESRVVQYNQRTDRILEDVIINYPNLVIQVQPFRARRVYRDREREFRKRKHLFLRIVDTVTANDRYFHQRPDATGRQSLSSLQKCTRAMRVLAYGMSFDAVDEYLRMSGVVTKKSLMSFVQGIISCFGDEYLRRPNENDLTRLLYLGEQHGFPGWAGQYAGRSGKPTIILEAVVSYDLWIWHAFFGTPGSCNDINVLHRSPIFSDVLEVRAPKVSYVVNGNQKNMAYYLTDGIYPSWAAFVKSITSPQIRKHRLFSQHQEAVRKDVERAFGVL